MCVCVKDLNRCKASTWFAAKLSNSSTRPSPEFSLRLFLSGHWFHQLISFYRRGWMHGLAVIHQRRHCLSMVIWRRDAFVTYLPILSFPKLQAAKPRTAMSIFLFFNQMSRTSVHSELSRATLELSGDVFVLHVGYIPLQQFEMLFWASVCVCGTSEQM